MFARSCLGRGTQKLPTQRGQKEGRFSWLWLGLSGLPIAHFSTFFLLIIPLRSPFRHFPPNCPLSHEILLLQIYYISVYLLGLFGAPQTIAVPKTSPSRENRFLPSWRQCHPCWGWCYSRKEGPFCLWCLSPLVLAT